MIDALPDIAGRELTVAEAIREVRAGRMALICDDMSREHEADLCLAAQFATAESLNFVLRHAGGLLCVPMTGERLDTLGIPLAERAYEPLQGTAFTASVDARIGTTTGISAADRATTVRALIDPRTKPEDLARPGHVFPLRAHAGGTLQRRGHTEAAVDLMLLAGLEPAAVICEVLDSNGAAARGQHLLAFAQQWNLGILSVDAIAHERRSQRLSLLTETTLPTPEATFRLLHYRETDARQEYLVLALGDLSSSHLPPPLVRLHSACTTGDIFGSQRCDCQAQMQAALQAIATAGRGLLLYLPQEGRGIGLAGKLQAYALQEQGCDTVEANINLGYPVDARCYSAAASILRSLGAISVHLLTNNPGKAQALRESGITVERVPLEITSNAQNRRYLYAKYKQLGHLLSPENVLQPQDGVASEQSDVALALKPGLAVEDGYEAEPGQIVVPSLIAGKPLLDGTGLRIGVVVARYNWHITSAVLQLAYSRLLELGVAEDVIHIASTPGTFELASLARSMLAGNSYDALICIGCVMKGATRHDVLVGDAAAQGIQRVALDSGIPVIFGVICAEDEQQAQERIARGIEYAEAAIEMARSVQRLQCEGEKVCLQVSLKK